MRESSPSEWAKWLCLDLCNNDPAIVGMVKQCATWARSYRNNERPARWLTILGDSGTGKTHAASRLFTWANEKAMGKGLHAKLAYIPHVIYWPDFIQRLRAGEACKKRDDMKDWPVVMLDDIGGERDTTGFAAEELHTLLGCRVGKWTLLTANLTMERLAKVDARIASRIVRSNNLLTTVQTTDFAFRRANTAASILIHQKEELGVFVRTNVRTGRGPED